MLQTLRNAWKIPELRKKIIFTLFILLIYRIGNVIPVPFIMVFIRRVFNWLREKSPWLRDRVDWLIRRAEKKSRLVRQYALVGLVILVAVPLPGTGAWTGSLVAALLDIRLRHSFPAVLLGVLIAGVVVLGICGGLSILL